MTQEDQNEVLEKLKEVNRQPEHYRLLDTCGDCKHLTYVGCNDNQYCGKHKFYVDELGVCDDYKVDDRF